MRERRREGGDGRLVPIKAQAAVSIGEHLRQMRHGWVQAGHRVGGAILALIKVRMLQQALVSLEADIPADPDAGSAADPLTGKNVVVADRMGINCRRRDKLRTAFRHTEVRLVTVHEPCQRPAVVNV